MKYAPARWHWRNVLQFASRPSNADARRHVAYFVDKALWAISKADDAEERQAMVWTLAKRAPWFLDEMLKPDAPACAPPDPQ